MISSKKELRFYCMADYMMNRGCFKASFVQSMLRLVYPDYIMRYLRVMRCYDYYAHRSGKMAKLKSLYYRSRFYRLGVKLGYSMACDNFGYGLRLPHYGSIVVGKSNRIGNYALILPGTCIVDASSRIGDAFFMAYGAVISKQVTLGDALCLAANSVLNMSCAQGRATLAGSPARVVKDDTLPWYEGIWGDDLIWRERVQAIEALRKKMFI